MVRLSTEQIIEAIRDSFSNYSIIASKLGIKRRDFTKLVDLKPAIRKYLVEEKEKTLDLAESKLLDAVAAGKEWAIKYYLNNQGVSRGYIINKEPDSANSQSIQLVFVDTDKPLPVIDITSDKNTSVTSAGGDSSIENHSNNPHP